MLTRMSRFSPDPDDLAHAARLRRRLHRNPELSGREAATARLIAAEMRASAADEVLTGLGGHGVAAVFGTGPGRRVLIRAELDALPIPEETGAAHASEVPGVAHLCGHDGHMAILVALARALGRDRPNGAAILLFQPAEEDGAGARAVLADPRTAGLRPDLVVSLHNLPGLPLGHVSLAAGPMACASRGMRVRLKGRAAHASQPETGVSPRMAVVDLLQSLPALGSEAPFPDDDFALVTVARVAMGQKAFGVSPGEAEVWATLRCLHDDRMAALVRRAETLVRKAAAAAGVTAAIDYQEVFFAATNHPAAVAALHGALDDLGVAHGPAGQPWRPSEDFGLLSRLGPAAMLFLGSGQLQPPLHDPQFDFPDALIAHGAAIWARLIERDQST